MRNNYFGFKKSSVNQTKTFIAHFLTCSQALPTSAKGSLWINDPFSASTMRKGPGFRHRLKIEQKYHQLCVQEEPKMY